MVLNCRAAGLRCTQPGGLYALDGGIPLLTIFFQKYCNLNINMSVLL